MIRWKETINTISHYRTFTRFLSFPFGLGRSWHYSSALENESCKDRDMYINFHLTSQQLDSLVIQPLQSVVSSVRGRLMNHESRAMT